MSRDFDPGPGWRNVQLDSAAPLGAAPPDTVAYREEDGSWSYWIRETPFPPLPTEPGYYVADRPSYGETVVVELLGSPGDQWVDAGDRQYLTHEQVQAMGPLIRLERRDVTAKAVLDEFEVWNWDTSRDTVARIAQMFGVES